MGLVPFFVTWTLIPIYLYLNPLVLHQHLVPFVVFAGLVNAYSVGQMITAHLAKLDFPYLNILVVPIFLAVVDSLGPNIQHLTGSRYVGWPSVLGTQGVFVQNEPMHGALGEYQVAYLFMMLGLAMGVYGSFVVDVIVTICDYLDIWCLTIKYHWDEKSQSHMGKPLNERVEADRKNL